MDPCSATQAGGRRLSAPDRPENGLPALDSYDRRGGPHRRTRRLTGGPAIPRLIVLATIVALLAGACGATSPTAAPTPSPTAVPTPAPPFPSIVPLPSAAPSSAPSATASASGSPAASVAVGPTATPGKVGTPLTWTSCGPPFECGTVTVPIDYTHPKNGTINLALIRLPASNPSQRIGDLLTNPGGPGASGVDFVRTGATIVFSAGLRARFDIVGFDPRGIGASDPVECLDGADMDRLNEIDGNPGTDPARIQAIIDGDKAFDAGCVANSGALLPFMTTIDAAKDMDLIRQALGDSKLTYLGFSYGTFLGSTYANLYPTRVRAFVLDGAIDPTLSFTDRTVQQAESFSAALNAFLADCASHATCNFYNGGHPQAAFTALMAQIEQAPLPALATGDPRPVGPAEADTAVAAAMYDQSSWPVLAQGLALAQRGDGSILLLIADSYNERHPDGTYTNLFPANAAVNCADYTVPLDLTTYEQLAPKVEALAPGFGASSVYGSLGCVFWPFHPAHDPVAPTAKGAPPILVVSTTGDPATPYEWGVKLAKELDSGVLLTRKGQGHTAYGGKSACIDAAVDAYLISLTVPKAGTVCS